MERQPAWSPDGQSIAYFSDESGQYALHIRNQTGAGEVKKFPLAEDATFYFEPAWSPDSKLIAFHDNKQDTWVLDTTTGKAAVIGQSAVDDADYDAAWSPDSKWLAYTGSLTNRFHALFLYSVDAAKSSRITDGMSDVRFPAFDRGGKYLYFTESTNYGMSTSGLDMSSDALSVTRSVYALVLAADTASPVAPQSEDEKKPEARGEKDGEKADAAKKPDEAGKEDKPEKRGKARKAGEAKAGEGRSRSSRESRRRSAPPPRDYVQLAAGKEGTLYLLKDGNGFRLKPERL